MKYFTFKELTYSNTALLKSIDNVPGEQEIKALRALVDNILDPLREWYGKPIRVNSAYRSIALNEAVGGAKSSQHVNGQAADITAGSKAENKRLFDYIKENLPFDQLIDEKNFSWVHVSFSDRNRRQLLKL